MIMKSEQDKLRLLLTQAIPLMCKNILHFKCEFSVEALIGVTLDKDHTLLVNINETMRANQDVDGEALNDPDIAPHISQDILKVSFRKPMWNPKKRKRSHRGNSPRKMRRDNVYDTTPSAADMVVPPLVSESDDILAASPDLDSIADLLPETDSLSPHNNDLQTAADSCDILTQQMLTAATPQSKSPCLINVKSEPADYTEDVNLCEDNVMCGNSSHKGVEGREKEEEEEPMGGSEGSTVGESVKMENTQGAWSDGAMSVIAGQHYSPLRLGPTQRYICHFCNKNYGDTRDIMDHISSVHLGVLRHQCEGCGKHFGWRSDVNKHKRKGRCPGLKNLSTNENLTLTSSLS